MSLSVCVTRARFTDFAAWSNRGCGIASIFPRVRPIPPDSSSGDRVGKGLPFGAGIGICGCGGWLMIFRFDRLSNPTFDGVIKALAGVLGDEEEEVEKLF